MFVKLNGKNVSLFFVREYTANANGTVSVQVEREGSARVLTGDEAKAFLATVEGSSPSASLSGLKEIAAGLETLETVAGVTTAATPAKG